MRACSLLDEADDGGIGEATFEGVPTFDLATPASNFELAERPQGAEKVVADGLLPTHEEAFGMADLFESTMVTLDAPVLAMHVPEGAVSDFHALFFRGSKAA